MSTGENAMIFVEAMLLFSRPDQLVSKITTEEYDSKVGDCSVNCELWKRLVFAGSGKKPGNDQTIIAGLAMTAVSPSDFHGLCSSIHLMTFTKTIELDIQAYIL